MSTSYMNYAEKLSLPMSPQSPVNPHISSSPTTAPLSSAPSKSSYKAYSPYDSPSPLPYSPQSSRPYPSYGGPALASKKSDAQQYAPYVPPPVYEKSSVPLDSHLNPLYYSPISPSNQSFATYASSMSTSPQPNVQIYTPYVPPTPVNDNLPTPPASQASFPHAPPVAAETWSSTPSVPPAPANNPSNHYVAPSVSSTQLCEDPSIHSTITATTPYICSPLRASNFSSASAASQAHKAIIPSTSIHSTSSTSFTARNPLFEKLPTSTPSPPGTHNVLSASTNEYLSMPVVSPPMKASNFSSPGGNQSYDTHALSAPADDQANIQYTAPSPAYRKSLNPPTPQPPASYVPSNQSAPSTPVTNQSNVSYVVSIPIHDNHPISSVSSSSMPHTPPLLPNNQRGSSHVASIQAQENHSTSSTSLRGSQNGPLAPANNQPIAATKISIPTRDQPHPSCAALISPDSKTPLPPPPPSTVYSPPAYQLHDGYFTSRPALTGILTPPTMKHDPSPNNHTLDPATQATQGLASPTTQTSYTPRLNPTPGTTPVTPVYNPQCMNQAYGSTAQSTTLAFTQRGQYPYTPELTPTGASTPQFPPPPGAAAATGVETKSSWGKRFVGDMLITRGIRAGVTSVASSVKLPAMLSPWGDNNPVTLPNLRRRDMVLLAGSHFGAEAIVSGSLTFASGLLVNAMQRVTEQVVDQTILDRIRFDEAKILRTTSVKSLQITIKHQLMGVDADLRFYGERSAPLNLLSYGKGWFCPYLYASGRTPSVPRLQNFAVAQCFGPFLNGKHDPHQKNKKKITPLNPPFFPDSRFRSRTQSARRRCRHYVALRS